MLVLYSSICKLYMYIRLNISSTFVLGCDFAKQPVRGNRVFQIIAKKYFFLSTCRAFLLPKTTLKLAVNYKHHPTFEQPDKLSSDR